MKRVSWWVAEPASLAFHKNDDSSNEYVVLAGWGKTIVNPHNPSRYLLEAKVKVLPNAVCENIAKNIFKKRMSLSNKYLCSKAEPYALLGNVRSHVIISDIVLTTCYIFFFMFCKGDSGGPVFRNNSYVVAVSKATCPRSSLCDSFVEVTNEHKFNVHISVDFYREFIDHVLTNY